MTDPVDNPQEETVAALDVEGVLALHCDPDGQVVFVRKPDPAHPSLDRDGKPRLFENLFSVKAADLRSMFPAMAEWLTHDSYMSVNAYYRPAPWKHKASGLPGVWSREEKYLRSLTACYADIDSGRPDSDEPGAALGWRQVLHEAGVLADAGVIPQPSIMARSGRGVYLFWLLRDTKNPEALPPAFPEKIALYKRCNRALNERLRTHQLPADPAATDAARVLRPPGSIHRKAMRRVKYVIQYDDHGRGFTYTLPELAAALDLPALEGGLPDQTRALARPAKTRRKQNPNGTPLRAHGRVAVNALRAQDLITIEAWRGGFLKRGMKYPDGTTSRGRSFVLALYANCLRCSGSVDATQALEALRAMAANCKPPYPSDPNDPTIEKLVAEEYLTDRRRMWPNKVLCPLLGITAEVARELDLKTIRPAVVALEEDQARPTQAEIVVERREWLRQWILEKGGGGEWTAKRVLALAPFCPRPWKNRETARQDLEAIGVVVRSRGGRPRRSPSE